MAVPAEFAIPVAVLVGVAAATDLSRRRVPNAITVPAALAGLTYHLLAPHGAGAFTSLAGFSVGFLLLLAPYILGGGGMGDVKLLAALGAWLGPWGLLADFVLSICLAAALTIAILASLGVRKIVARNHGRFEGTYALEVSHTTWREQMLPFALPVALATWLLLAWMTIRP